MLNNKNNTIFKEDTIMIHTDAYKHYGQLEEQAQTGDIEAFVFRNGEVIPASQADTSQGPVIHTATEKNYGQMEQIANGTADVEEFVFRDGEVVPASQVNSSLGPVVHTSSEKNFAGRKAN